MLILGTKHKFTNREKEQLAGKFEHFDTVLYKNRKPSEVIKDLGKFIKTKKYKYLILNTVSTLDPKVIRYLTLIQFRTRRYNLRVITIESFMEKELKKCYIPKDEGSVNFLAEIQPYTRLEYGFKRFIDIFGGGCLWAISLILKPFVTKKIYEQSPGNIYFIQARVGFYNKEFNCVKYRSMRLDAEEDGAKFASKDDNRTFPFGNIMRKTRIDEIPQYINVLKGEMHLIGPRPERAHWIRQFEKNIPYYNERHLVAPGITGWAQVNYPYGENEEDARQKLMYDLYYIKHWSPWLEMKTMFKTIVIIFGRKGM